MALLKQFIEEFSNEIDSTEPLAPNEDQSYSILLDPDLLITVNENPQTGLITFFTKLAKCPSNKTEEFLLKAMQANLLGHETGGGILGLDKDGSTITFGYFFLNPMNYNEFRNSLEDFANYAEVWREETVNFEDIKTKPTA